MRGLRAVVAGLILTAALAGAPAAAAEMTKAQEAAMGEIFQASQEGNRLFGAGRYVEAEAIFRRVAALTEEAFPGEDLMRASALHNLAGALSETGRLAEARTLAAEALAIREAAGNRVGSMAVGSSRALLASILRDLGRRAEGGALMRSAFVVVAEDPQADGSLLVENASKLIGVMAEDGQIAEADGLAKDLLGLLDRMPDADKIEVFWSVARLRSEAGRFAEAEQFYGQAYELLTRNFPEDVTRRAILLSNIASVIRQQFRPREAEELFRRAAADLQTIFPDGHPALASALDGLGLTLAEQGRPADAWPVGRKALDMRVALLPVDHPLIATSLVNLGLALFRDGQPEPARDSFQTAVDRRTADGDAIGAARAAVNLANAEAALGDNAGAIRTLEAARDVLDQSLPKGHPLTTTAAVNQAWFLLAEGEPLKALAAARQAADGLAAARELADNDLDAVPADEDKRRIVVAVAAAWDVADGK